MRPDFGETTRVWVNQPYFIFRSRQRVHPAATGVRDASSNRRRSQRFRPAGRHRSMTPVTTARAWPPHLETRVFFEAPVPRVSDASVFETVRFTGATRCFCFSASRALRRRSGNSPTRCYPRNLADFDSRTVAPWKRRPAPTRFFTGKKELTLQTAKVKRSRNTTFDVSAFSSRKHPPSRRRREAHAAFPARAAAERRAPTREDAVLR